MELELAPEGLKFLNDVWMVSSISSLDGLGCLM